MNRRGGRARTPLAIAVLFLLALVPFALYRSSKVPEAEAAWWNSSWQYRQSIAVTNNTTEQTNVYISVSLDTSNTTKFQADCGDLRFTKQNGQLLPYYIVSGCGTASTSVHVQLDTFPAGAQTFYAYYGNPSADNGFSSNDFLTQATNYTVGGTGSEEIGPGPVAYWKFDEGSGSTAFDSANYGLGGELLTDGNMEAADTSAWSTGGSLLTKNTSIVRPGSSGSRSLQIEALTTNAVASQNKLTVGKTYRITGWVRGDGTNGLDIWSGLNIVGALGAGDMDWHYFDKTFVAGSTAIQLKSRLTVGHIIWLDDVSVAEVVSGNHGTISGATWANENQCVSGKCLSFDGTNDYVDMGNNPRLEGFDNVSISFWYKTATLPSSITTVIGKEGVYKISLNQSGQIRFLTGNNWAGSVLTTSTTLSTGRWHHIAATYDGSIKRVYINGTPDTSTVLSSGSLGSSSNKFVIGATSSPGFTGFTPGLIDEPKIFPYALTEDQIKTEYNLGSAAVMGTGPTVVPPAGGPLSDSLVAHWAFDEQYGQTAHDKVGNNHGTFGASTSPGSDDPTWKPAGECKVNGCASFDGGDSVNLGHSDSFEPESFSLSVWIKTSDTSSNRKIISKENYPNRKGYNLYIESGYIKMYLYNGTSGTAIAAPTQYSAETWYHVTGVYNGQTDLAQLYINGELVRTRTYANQTHTGNSVPLNIGRDPIYGAFWLGKIDEVKIYNTALTADQVKQEMNAGASVAYSVGSEEADELADGAGAPPIAEWKFDEKQGTVAYDSSGNANDGTVNGATWRSGCQQGACLVFDGVDDYVNLGTSPLLLPDVFTFEAWVKVSDQEFYPLARWNTSTPSLYIDSPWQPNKSLLYLGGSNYRYFDHGLIDPADGKWHHITFVVTGNGQNDIDNSRMYIDGQPLAVATTTKSGLPTPKSYLEIGRIGGSSFLNGQIDHVRIYNYARTPAQIAYDYNRGAPVAHWKFDECEGTVAHDASGNENHGTINIGASGSQTTAGTCSTSGVWANGASGKFEGSLNFDGFDDVVTIPDTTNSAFDSSLLSIAFWVKAREYDGAYEGVMSKASRNNSYAGPWTILRSNVAFRFSLNGDNTISAPADYVNNWVHVVFTYNGGVIKGYINGALVVQKNYSGGITPTNDDITLGVGYALASNRYFNGQIDDVRIFNYALSPAQVKKVYNQGYGVRYAPSN